VVQGLRRQPGRRRSSLRRISRVGEPPRAEILNPGMVRQARLGAVADEDLARKFHDNAVRSLPEERAAEIAARTLALPDARSVEDLTALLTSAGER
jgi:hypothetical protein